eukprot:m.297966 g.297966  ORF g.297966 m.297966 type:complete len:225 (+) comp20090_c0_seq1:230-904(+)
MAGFPVCRVGVSNAIKINAVRSLTTTGSMTGRNTLRPRSQQNRYLTSALPLQMSHVVKMPDWIAPQKDEKNRTVWWSTDGQNHNGESRNELERVLGSSVASEVLSELGEEFYTTPVKKREFPEALRKTAFIAIGPTFEGVQFEAIVLSVDNVGLKVDYGGKFPARLRHSGLDTARMQVGDRVVMVLHDVERAEHLLGDPRNTSVHLALGSFVRAVDGTAHAPRK